ncbi:hypothetical protein GUITHDRAFT_111605 [Guillardia theta CCMP2712]|uniref:Uncharacterized protein n=1 Tax=Guillardia theta (strain CCMP2712) TaxID=905079 RepID=L1J1F5_GUITC|nr:hypothetical protein GUITHDRAFT_111605 [Guillardia theta CCMP2712]EKX42331.1 hypothetical protein GUITHDRAFT_111605 [Guillardia theta CCMP2712]|eukprot:XP_005829311.1 hypothetical protein GUITHDRAFT_111605 [Guillardia theta CCMP2712]
MSSKQLEEIHRAFQGPPPRQLSRAGKMVLFTWLTLAVVFVGLYSQGYCQTPQCWIPLTIAVWFSGVMMTIFVATEGVDPEIMKKKES